jgi:type II secretory pathway component PulF
MLYFDYRAKVSNSNKVFRGIVTADSTETALDNLKSKGLTIVEIFPIIDFLSIRKTLYSFSDRITKKTIQEFFEQLAFMLDTDIALYDALTILRDNGASKKIMALARPIAECVRKGLSLHEAMECLPLAGHNKACLFSVFLKNSPKNKMVLFVYDSLCNYIT